MKVAAGRKPDRSWMLMECRVRVFKILPVLANLNGRMKNVPLSPADPARYDFVRLGGLTTLPLLEFNDDRLVTGVLITTADHTVNPFRGKRQLVFEENAMIVKSANVQNIRHGAQRIAPGIYLGGRRLISVVREKRVTESFRNTIVRRISYEIL